MWPGTSRRCRREYGRRWARGGHAAAAIAARLAERGGEVGALAEVERRLSALIQSGASYSLDNLGYGYNAINDALRVVREVAAQQPPDPLAEGVEALATAWEDSASEYAEEMGAGIKWSP